MKQKKFVAEYIRTGSKKKAALYAYDTSQKEAQNMATQVWKHPFVQQELQRVMEKAGLSDDVLAEGLRKIIKWGTKKRALMQTQPQVALEGIKFVAKLKDIIPAEKTETKTASLNLNLEGKSEEELKGVLDNLLAEVQGFKKMLVEQS